MKILVLGGTVFVGRVLVEHALDAGHEVTVFNRGKTNPGLFPDVEHLRGDRNADLSQLEGRRFDAVVDTSAYFPRQVLAIAEALGSVEHYTFVSSASVYADQSVPGLDESAAVAVVEEPTVEELGENYGGFKALCEAALERAMPGRVHSVRAGLIVGPYDNTGRFSYWVERLCRGGEILAPEPGDQPVQFIDVRDLADWILLGAARGLSGPINAIGPPGLMTMASLLAEMQRVLPGDSDLIWVGEEFLLEHEVEPWSELPLWLPLPIYAGFMSRSNDQAARNGLTLRPLADTVAATRDWLAVAGPTNRGKDFGVVRTPAGLTPQREQDLLRAWAARAH
jgi:2'-hydroxyisoflavone reductase